MNQQTETDKALKINFKDYYFSIKQISPRAEFRTRICKRLDISEWTLWNKIRDNRFTKLEREAIADEVGMDIETLFPGDQQ